MEAARALLGYNAMVECNPTPALARRVICIRAQRVGASVRVVGVVPNERLHLAAQRVRGSAESGTSLQRVA